MSLRSKFRRFFEMDDDVVEQEVPLSEEEQYAQHENKQGAAPSNVVSLQSVQKSSKVMLLEPRSYEEVQDIADHLCSRKAVIINLQRVPKDQGRRIVDFLSGTVYAIGGDIQKVGSQIFFCAPENVDISGAITEIISERDEHY
ncbi:cell division protein SepF [Marinococcus halophilus]|uniref:Cell division protein SepF n=1 Tax=Marinococcus halophilus TaxID=1371 RepID=A0A510Y1Y0_MARHA|nr:cell division protein SepF [Marinococcus halophilus]OZT81371.1 cell division protein SepF [Marinococcus halophilus]GEK57322.1 cell division protein SepF [Marinococcus halophilus]